jgi:DNA-binding response OmpR family regulator
MKKKIFIVDDEQDILDIVKINLTAEGYDVHAYPSAAAARKGLAAHKPDLMILDIMMEGTDGYDFCRELRQNPEFKQLPVIFLSAKSDELDKVLGLELGADDYMTKPFGQKELKSRVKAVLRRSEPARSDKETASVIRWKGIELNADNYCIKVDGSDISVTRTEFLMMEMFLRNPGKIFSRDNIIDSIKGDNVYVVDRTIDVHIMNLRKKLGPYKDAIKTFSGVGYGLRD